MAKRPASLIYGVDERPPWSTLVLLGVQHIFLMSSSLVFPVVLVKEIGGSFQEVCAVVALTMIACGMGTILQAVRWGVFGSGFLCPNLCGPNFFTACMQAAWLGGLPLMRGMIIAAGLVEALFAGAVRRVRFLFPPEITGLVVLMVAVEIIPLAASKCFGINFEGEPILPKHLLVAALTLLVMVMINLRSRGSLKLYNVLIGLAAGYSISWSTGLLNAAQFNEVLSAPWLALPYFKGMFSLDFQWALLPTFAIVSITGALKSFGNLIMCEKVNDEEWREPDINRISGGLLADSVAVVLSGLLGGLASDTSASNVALSSATGATSRWIGIAAGGLFIALAFSPKIGSLLSIMPAPVMGAILVFVICFMIMSGLQIIIGTGVDQKRIFVIGIPLLFGLCLEILPALFEGVPYWLQPLVSSALTLSTVLAVILNQALRPNLAVAIQTSPQPRIQPKS
jgi:NCS2 family nucleobase:cation symporter-2